MTITKFHKSWLLGAAGAAAFAATALTPDPAEAAFCLASEAGCATAGFNVESGTFLGRVHGGDDFDIGDPSQPQPDDIAALKLAAGEIDDVDLAVQLTKLDDLDSSTITVEGQDVFELGRDAPIIDSKSGTFMYTGADDISLVNVTLKGGSTSAAVFALSGLSAGDTFDWSSPQGISNIQFTEVVPLPAAAWMMIGGLGLVAGAARKFRRPEAAAA